MHRRLTVNNEKCIALYITRHARAVEIVLLATYFVTEAVYNLPFLV